MFEKILERTVKKLARSKSQKEIGDFALVGGLAVARWGIPRATLDIDFIIKQGNISIKEFATKIEGEARIGRVEDPLLAVVTLKEKDEYGELPVQLIQFPPAWEALAFEAVVEERISGFRLPIVDWKALVLLKLYAGGSHDLQDASNIIAVNAPSATDIKTLKSRASALRVSRRLERVLRKK